MGPVRRSLRSRARRLPDPVVEVLSLIERIVDPERRRLLAAEAAEAERTAKSLEPLEGRVHGGPFAGMKFVGRGTGWKYVAQASWGGPGPYLVGSYEEELHPHLERLIAKHPRLVVDVGAAEGYYAVGLAIRLPAAHVIAADIDWRARRACRRMATLNGVGKRLTTASAATHETLERWLRTPALVIVDCEGCELDLLRPEDVPALRSVDLIVELHDFVDSRATATIARRFANTHRVTIVESTERKADSETYPALALLPRSLWAEVVDEHRPRDPHPMRWAILETVGV
jgi:hypothetical protein